MTALTPIAISIAAGAQESTKRSTGRDPRRIRRGVSDAKPEAMELLGWPAVEPAAGGSPAAGGGA